MEPIQIGKSIFNREEMFASLIEFGEIYDRRPFRDNRGGMSSCHLFGTWYAAKKLNPSVIIESGVFKGQGTWVLREACPNAIIYCIDPRPWKLEYTPLPEDRIHYSTEDFNKHPWGHIIGKNIPNTLCFFDDHQDADNRLITALTWGFRHLMFEDNYPRPQGDCISLKTMLEEGTDSKLATNLLEVYCEMPPVHKVSTTRWGDPWTPDKYPTLEPLIRSIIECPPHQLDCFIAEAQDYTWLCYAKMKPV